MVANEAYIGNLVSGKSGTYSYKNQKKVRKNSEDWIRVEGTHPAIIPLELWERVQTLSRKGYRPSRLIKEKSLFAGLLHCNKCGFRLRSQVEKRTRKDGSESKRVSYMCSTYGRSGKNACTIHSISEKALIELVADPIRAHFRTVNCDEERIMQGILSEKGKISYLGSYQNEFDAHRLQIEKLDILIENLCEDKSGGLIPDSLYKRQISKYEQERTDRVKAMEVLKKRINDPPPASTSSDLIKRHIKPETLDNDTLYLLVDKIIVHEAQYIGGKRICEIEVVHNYENLQRGDLHTDFTGKQE
jgi:hypothetical protein